MARTCSQCHPRSWCYTFTVSLHVSVHFYPHNAMHKLGLSFRPVSDCLSRWCIGSTWLKISSHFLFGLIGPSLFSYLTPCTDTQFQVEPHQWGCKIHGGGESWWFLTEMAVYLHNGASGTLVGSHRWRIDPCWFRWPWVTFAPRFQGHIFRSQISQNGVF